MPYEIYERIYPTKSTNPTVTISPLGRCSLNRAAASLFQKEAVENVLLLWDRDALRMAIRPITKKDNRAFRIRYQEKDKAVTGAAFSGVLFLKHIGYNSSTTATYPVKWNMNESIFEIELPADRFGGAPLPTTSEGRTKTRKEEKATKS